MKIKKGDRLEALHDMNIPVDEELWRLRTGTSRVSELEAEVVELTAKLKYNISATNEIILSVHNERDERRAQLARCVEVLIPTENYMTEQGVSHEYPVMINLRKVINSLSTTAKYDAEILRCAGAWYELHNDDNFHPECLADDYGNYQSRELFEAIRTRNEVK
jgi:hypothetical protein